ncbi:MAG: Transcriptional regulator, LysR family [uncultured Ramlibacter sp.]|uniref:Transcriptional regulator, LysR family n=1 Tax=uncultured Ramlibacter sp. TaxID=260755 RepID=A0A6J4PJK4_9BURK|nr:MAG: Transcriptional regulator, LysR family [uncultured Ramlibacter sp.]
MNFKHLHYFWTVARTGSIARASEQLHLTPQTLSGQIKQLEERLGKTLLRKAGRGLEPTDAGRMVQRYADEIFAIGSALQEALQTGREGTAQAAFRVGVADSVPKSIACHVLEPCLAVPGHGRLVCHEGKLNPLLADLAVHRLDLVLSDVPLPASLSVKAYTHLLGRTEVSFFAAEALLGRAGWTARRARARFPACLAELPLLMPSSGTALRPRLDAWLRESELAPPVAAEFDDAALTKAFGRQGAGVFAGPAVLAAEIENQYEVVRLGTVPALVEEFYALSIERRITHPAVSAITTAARRELFAR